MSLLFTFISATPLVKPADLYGLARATEQAARFCAEAWSLAPPAVDVCVDAASLPAGCCPVVFVDDNSEPGVLAEHFVGRDLLPAARVYVGASTGLNDGDWSMSEGATHEVFEALVDPEIDRWVDHPTRPGVEVALENCDPAQGFFFVEAEGQSWRVSNFVTPAWFDPKGTGRLDWVGELAAPGAISSLGYVILRDKATGEIWTEDASGARNAQALRKPGARHPWARSVRRLRPTA